MDVIPTSQAARASSPQELVDVAAPELHAQAVVLHGDERVFLERLPLRPPRDDEVIVDTEASGISTGTEKLFWSGTMPPFPGMGYPLVPGYETVGRVVWASRARHLVGERVFVPGTHGFKTARSLFGGAASRLVAPERGVHPIGELPADEALLLSLAATAHHALNGEAPPDLIVGFGALGRLLLRLGRALGHPEPKVWEVSRDRQQAEGVEATTAELDDERSYRQIYDASGNAAIIDRLIGSLAKGGTLTLAGFYTERLSFAFAPAFQKEARLRIAAEWCPEDLEAVLDLVKTRRLSLSGLVSHSRPWTDAEGAYRTAFTDPNCFKMMLDWEAH